MTDIVSAALLAAAAIAVWFIALGARAPARIHLRFASMLFAALAIAAPVAPLAVNAIALLVGSLGTAILCLAALAGFETPMRAAPAASLLALVCVCGICAAVTGVAGFALVPATLASAAIAILSARQFDVARLSSIQGMLAALAFFAAASAFALDGAAGAHILFSAAGLLGLTLALSRASNPVVEQQRHGDLRNSAAIRDLRQV